MKNVRNKTVLGLMILAAIVSGCTGGGGSEENEGSQSLTVNEFSGFPNPVPADQNVQFRMQLVNDGAEDVDTAFARLYNPPFGSGDQVFSNTSGKNPTPSYRTLEFSDLRAEGDQTPAVPQTQQVTFNAPNLSQDRDLSYSFNADIFFGYETVGDAEIQILSQEAFREEGASQGTAGLENSRAPVQLEVRTPTPIRIFDSSDGSVTKQFCVIARNQGQGTPFDPEEIPPGDGFSRSSIQDEEGEVEIGVQDVGDQVTFTADGSDSQTKTVEILQGKAVACFDMTISGADSTFQTTVPIRVEADYGYKKTANANLRVDGRGEASEIGGGNNNNQESQEDVGSSEIEDPKPNTEYRYNSGVAQQISNSLTSTGYNNEDYSKDLSFDIADDNSEDQQDLACGLLKEYQEETGSDQFDQNQFTASCTEQ